MIVTVLLDEVHDAPAFPTGSTVASSAVTVATLLLLGSI